MSYLLDTNIISEVRKGERAAPSVQRWYRSVREEDLYLSVLTTGEIRQGIERARRSDIDKARALESWLLQVVAGLGSRLLPITAAIANEWGRINARRPLPAVDSLLAATALVHELTLVTRNTGDVAESGARLLDPFT